jgi:hypothetical protein
VKFYSEIAIIGVNPYVLIDAHNAALLCPNWRKPLPVGVRIDEKPKDPHHINLMPVGDGSFFLYLNSEIRGISGTKVGDTVLVEVEFNATYKAGPAHPMPRWFSGALDENQRAKKTWADLPPSRKKEVLRHFAKLKTPKAREKNLLRAVSALSDEKTRFLGRHWKSNKETRK